MRQKPVNLLNLPDLTGASVPSFLRMDRFRLLDFVVERCKARALKHTNAPGVLAKQIAMTPFDVSSSRRFNLLAWPGAFSGAYVDSGGST
ncbi:hypothetical protein CLAFUW4_09810 [Fulvia fulva]|uniref:Uncharacterized protein n=1 Tax=Passalora fulva TaxID=5499 RepID=A0A9Q8UUN5_PASFU|nr:uncharacterized protein CLAFUR5_12428 [Fulvia fulva]KAK4615707.1 hypothetical protein CLAFUR4_09816 [Fulvia fulva]KAK4616432.1 hypothetical protein CLAFUR0_09809 [Fulvia fulva]UJO23065.1 hypothetical protein CLAFUR5_12428 [Fulvia fulva]WPV18839.1 hypothetical protein CLAFUW4_09810 [Fulvia fulva]WPV33875.1 hypothetical protein CLAFUW7_09813 [Fulvia fulva]